MTAAEPRVVVRNTRPEDFDQIIALTGLVYPASVPWSVDQLKSHLRVFPEGQLVAVDTEKDEVVGMAASLIILWDDYEHTGSWREFTDRGMFTNHDTQGRTLYGAEVMVHPQRQRMGIGGKIYVARREIAQRFGLKRIRAGARLRGYHKVADQMSAADYVARIVRGEEHDPTLSFQIKNGFEVMAVVQGYLSHDPRSLGWAALIEWLNPLVAKPEDAHPRDPRFYKPE